ncbi:aKG-HExxH-type peptide beta-hydroxylase [Actinoplanes sp. CA-015351]|uniref:aKG-HExxH-type peptide beta-hydroxylase n=1 Tax=Actinoplanes sp. CA-015351 TaxID=3239897 RepID=UPI003D98842C
MTEVYHVSAAELDEMASGPCGASSMRLLRNSQFSRNLLLLRHITDAAPASAARDDALSLIDAARAHDPGAASRVLSDPMISAWINRVIRRLHGSPEPSPDWRADLGQMTAVAATVAAEAGVDGELPLEHRGETVTVPTRGVLTVSGEADRPLTLRVRSHELIVSDGNGGIVVPPASDSPDLTDSPTQRWHGLRRLSAPAGDALVTVTLDDLTPYRDVFHAPATDRIDGEEFKRWRRLFTGAAGLLDRHAGNRTAEILQASRTVVPLRADGSGTLRSGTARHVFGAFGTTRPVSAAVMALTMVHEIQHSKLNAILELKPLFDSADPKLYFAPWRADPRPMWGLFHGVYAFLAAADVLNRMRAEPAQEMAAEEQFARVRGQLRTAMNSLLSASSLTSAGYRFASVMDRNLRLLEDVSVSRQATDSANRTMDRTRDRWRERNGRAD